MSSSILSGQCRPTSAVRGFILLVVSVLLSPHLFVVSSAEKSSGANKSVAMTDEQRVAHVLSRLTYGARPGDFDRVKAMGVEAFINQQLDPDSIEPGAVIAKLKRLPTLGMATPVLIEQYPKPKPNAVPSPAPARSGDAMNAAPQMPGENPLKQTPTISSNPSMSGMPNEMPSGAGTMSAPGPQQSGTPTAKPSPPPKEPQMVVTELQRARLLRAVYSERQLFEVMVEFWENHFNIFANKDDDRYLLTSFDREAIRPFAMGRFRDLLGATAHSPAMLYYLDNWRSSVARPYPAKGDKPAGVDGGLNENYARELMELHTLGVNGGYTQQDVQEVARCFSGWTILKPNEQGLFLYRPGLHDDGEKVVLGHRILPGGGIADGERVLDILATHPSTAQFVATKLARRFIGDDPPATIVNRAAAVFLKTDGSIRETLRAILTSPEFFSQSVYRAKMRSPFEYAAAAMRALNAETDADPSVVNLIGRMGQPLFGRVTPDGYADRAEQWLSSGAMVARFNFASALATNRLKGTSINLTALLSGSDREGSDAVTAQLAKLTVMGDLSPNTRAALVKVLGKGPEKGNSSQAPPNSATVAVGYESNGPAAGGTPPYAAELLTLLLGSPEFQRR